MGKTTSKPKNTTPATPTETSSLNDIAIAQAIADKIHLTADDFVLKPKQHTYSPFQLLVNKVVSEYFNNYLDIEIKLTDLTKHLKYHLFNKENNYVDIYNNSSITKKIETTKVQTYNIDTALKALENAGYTVTNNGERGINKKYTVTKK